MKRYFKLYSCNGAWHVHLKTFSSHVAQAKENAKEILNSMGLTGNFILINEFDAQIIEFSI
jgi:hypothetical protein